MAECTFCKAETQLYVNGVPVCVACGDKRHAKPADVRTVLAKAIADATARVSAANQVFHSVMNEAPTGFPHPDGAQRIHNASRELFGEWASLVRLRHNNAWGNTHVCPACSGNGRCAACYGSGTNIHLNEPTPECRACGGSGSCLRCKGTGDPLTIHCLGKIV
jgi:hypothetical protein